MSNPGAPGGPSGPFYRDRRVPPYRAGAPGGTAGPFGRAVRSRAAILRREQEIADAIDTAYRHMFNAIAPQVDRIVRALQDARDAGEVLNYSWLLRGSRLRDLITVIRERSDTFAVTAEQLVTRGQRITAAAADADARAMLDDLLGNLPRETGIPLSWSRMPVEALHALAGRSAYNDTPLSRLFAGFGQEAASKARAILYTAMATGDNPSTIATRLANALNISRNRARTIARTEMMGAYRDATIGTYRANADVVTGWQWLAGPGACQICVDLDGSQHGLDEDFDGAHVNCRCSCAPLTRSYSDILSDYGVDAGDNGSSVDEVE